MMDIVDTIKTKAEAEGYRFAYGTRPFLNYEATLKDVTAGEDLFLLLPVTKQNVYAETKITASSVQYDITFQIARKFDNTASSGTKAELAETFQQKHERRLADLLILCETFVKELMCENNFEPVSSQSIPEINQYATTVDAYNCNVIFNSAE